MDACTSSPTKQQRYNERLGKKLTYLLRYGVEKEGLSLDANGFVDLNELMKVPLLRCHTKEEVLNELLTSVSQLRNIKRYEVKEETNGLTLVKATYGHRLQRNPYHEGTKVERLFERSLNALCDSIQYYDFDDFPDNYLLGLIIRRLKERNLLTIKNLKSLMVPSLTHLDLYNIYVTESALKLIPKKCPNLKWITFRSCSYVITDHVLPHVLKGLSLLENLNLEGCHHVTEKSFAVIQKYCKNLVHLNLSNIAQPSPESLINLIKNLPRLEELLIYDLKEFSTTDLSTFLAVVDSRKFRLETAAYTSESANSATGTHHGCNSAWLRPNFR